MNMVKKAHSETIEDITEHCDKQCILKAMALRVWSDRDLEQERCVGFYKNELEKTEDKLYTWTEIKHKWCDESYAEKFSEVYDEHGEHLKAKAIYNVIMGREVLERDAYQNF